MMPRARNRTERGWQVFHWLAETFPETSRPVDFGYAHSDEKPEGFRGIWGWVTVNGRRFDLRVNLTCCIRESDVIETLLHEYAHCMEPWHSRTLLAAEVRDHDDPFWIFHGRLWRAYYDDGGMEESKGYPTVGRMR